MIWLKYFIEFTAPLLAIASLVAVFSPKEKISFLDRSYSQIMKGMAILCVVLCHFMGAFGGGVTLFTPLGGIGVAVFLVLSGYGLSESWKFGGGILV